MYTNEIYERVKTQLSNENGRVVVGVQAGYTSKVYTPKHLPTIKAEGNGLRIGKTFVFASQVYFATVRKV